MLLIGIYEAGHGGSNRGINDPPGAVFLVFNRKQGEITWKSMQFLVR